MKSFSILRVSAILLVGAALCAAAFGLRDYAAGFFSSSEDKPDTSEALKVGGSSVVFFIMDKWKHEYADHLKKKDKNETIDIIYTSSGSVAGRDETIDKLYQIGFSSGPLNEKKRSKAKAKGGEMVQIPVVLIAVAPIYNVKELNDKPPLKLTGEVLADIFMGKITKWNDPALKKLNDGVELPDKKIIVVHRKDKSGTTLLFTKYLEEASEGWKKTMGPASEEVKWPVGDAIPRNYGVAGHVKRTEGAIGYVESLHAMTNRIRACRGAERGQDRIPGGEARVRHRRRQEPERRSARARRGQPDQSPRQGRLPDLRHRMGRLLSESARRPAEEGVRVSRLGGSQGAGFHQRIALRPAAAGVGPVRGHEDQIDQIASGE